MAHRESGVRDFSDEQETPIPTGQQMTEEQFEDFLAEAREMVFIREQKARVVNRESELKRDLMDQLAAYGQPYGDSGQHRAVDFPEPIRNIIRFVRQSKVTTEVNETKAEAIARQRGIYGRLFKPVMQLDDAAVMVALEEGLLTEKDIEEIFPKKTTYAFVAEKDKKR